MGYSGTKICVRALRLCRSRSVGYPLCLHAGVSYPTPPTVSIGPGGVPEHDSDKLNGNHRENVGGEDRGGLQTAELKLCERSSRVEGAGVQGNRRSRMRCGQRCQAARQEGVNRTAQQLHLDESATSGPVDVLLNVSLQRFRCLRFINWRTTCSTEISQQFG